jgi:uncharacterized repeat protein (TIGR02543 family)
MFRSTFLALLSVAAFAPAGLATTLSSVDHTAVPVGEKITFTGSGFTGTTAVTFFWNRSMNSANFNVVSDTKLEATFPDVTQNIRDRYVLVESSAGSALTMSGSAVEFTGTGSVPNSFPAPAQIIAKAGSVLQGYPSGVTVVYVESGAVLQNPPGSGSNLVIFAESGAVLDFRGTVFSTTPPLVLHSTGATVLGSLPPASPSFPGGGTVVSRQIPPLTLHRGVGPFTLGVRVNLSVVGNGSATVVPDGPFIRHSTPFTVTATPGPGALFQGWSGTITGTTPEMTGSSGTSDRNIVATFTQGYTLATFSGSWGTIAADPELDAHAPGQTVQLSATPAPGYQFVGWGGDLAGSSANPLPVTMNSNKTVTAIFEPVTPPVRPRVTRVDHPAVPVGEISTLTGSGFTGTTAVSYYWLPYVHAATFTEVSDTELRVVFPEVTQNIRDRFLLIESAAGSTVTLGGEVLEITGVASPPASPSELQILAKAGSVLRGFPSTTRVVFVESGAVLQNVPGSAPNCVILAADGATLDFRGTTFSASSPPRVLYSPGTTLLGSLPAPTGGIAGSGNAPRQVPSLTLSRDIGPFTLGVRVNLSVVGNGSATVDPAGPFVRHSTGITLTATPASGWLFQGWSGSVSSSNPVFTTSSGTTDRNIVATFTSGYTLTTHAGSWGTITPDPVQETYPPDQPIGLSASPLPGYRFVKWGGDLAGTTDNPAVVTMNGNKLVTAVFEPVAPPPNTLITSVDPPAVPVGETLRFTGSGFTGTSAVSFFWRPYINAAEFTVVSDTELRVVFPNVAQPFRDRFVLVETPAGSTVTMAGAITDFTGVGSLTSLPAPFQIVVKAGSVLNGFPPGARVVYVESGAVLRQVPSSSSGCVIFAENGSTLDLRGVAFSSSTPPLFLHGPGTTILGSLPAPAGGIAGPVVSRQIPPPSLSRDIGPFIEGFELVLIPEGPGSVTVDPVMEFYPRGTAITLTAVPNPGNHFIRWSGGISGTTNPFTFTIGSSFPVTARFSDRPDFFTGWRQRYFTTLELADPAISGLDADPDGDQVTNAGEYAFGSDPRVSDGGSGIRILPGGNPQRDGNLRLVYVRPSNAADIDYILQASKTAGGWFDGTSGDVTFEVIEESALALGDDRERITLLMNFTGEIPKSLFFRLTADIGDLP